MEESSWGLRIALLVIGLAVIAGVYVLGVLRRRRRALRYRHNPPAWSGSRYTTAGDSVIDDERDHDPVDDEIVAVRVRKVEPLTDLPVIKNDVAAEAELARAPEPPARRQRPTRGRRKRIEDQLAFGFGGAAELPDSVMKSNRSRAAPAERTILTLYLRPSSGPALVGPAIVRNANAVGLRHGEQQIFHHFGAGELQTERPLFSLANMFEPGHFDLTRIEAFQTAGLVMFLKLPASLDGPVAFELFLNTAQRLAEGLQAELLHDPKILLDSASIDRMRQIAAQYANES